MSHLTIRLLLMWCCWSGSAFLVEASVASLNESGLDSTGQSWARLLGEAEQLHLPTKFLRALPPNFIHFEFDDLRTYAAEYHPGEHRMRLNRTLSLNAAGRTLKPLGKMTHKELEVLYHELFHAYMDYLMVSEAQAAGIDHRAETLVRFAKEQQVCRYEEVVITPIVQRTAEMESRYLTPAESWEALNETWAVFVGWAVWNQLELQRKSGRFMLQERGSAQQWIQRFKVALEREEFRGYYVPQDPEERRVAQKRYLAGPSQLTMAEGLVLMEQVFGFPDDFMKMVHASIDHVRQLTCPPERERTN